MERIRLDYEPLRAAVARGDRAHIEAQARKLRDQHLADLVVRAAAGAWSVIVAIGRRVFAWRKHRHEVAPKVDRLLNSSACNGARVFRSHNVAIAEAGPSQVTGAGLKRTSALCSFHCSAQVFLRPLATSSMSRNSSQP